MKDNFSIQASGYAKFRPTYPVQLVAALAQHCPQRSSVWDCGCGNGQLSVLLSDYFDEVSATDLSEQQIANAIQKSNISYSVGRAENTTFRDNSFDMITIAQAIHWFDFEVFYQEVRRVAKPNAIIAAIGYPLFRCEAALDSIIQHFYYSIIAAYWDAERKYLDEHYQTIPFPFEAVSLPSFYMEYSWSLQDLIGYLNTWSAVQHYIKRYNNNPIDLIYNDLEKVFFEKERSSVRFELVTRIGKIH
jgi:SAM-dependent methyltransferase